MNGFQEARNRELIGLFLRLSIGILFFIAGLSKLFGGLQHFAVDYIVREFSETWIPNFLLYPFAYLLPFFELIGGFFLIVGLFTRRTLVVMGIVLLLLEFGKAVQKDSATVAQIANYILILCAALWAVREDPYSVDALRSSA
jgi:thiosulfate dehydrogenase [quinone] large subunit